MQGRIHIIFLLFISCKSYPLFAQSLHGTYCTNNGFVGDCIHFKKDKTFQYDAWGCFGSSIGTGTYLLGNDSLVLRFDPMDSTELHLFTVERESSAVSDSALITIIVTDDQEMPLSSAYISMTYYYQGDTTHIIQTAKTDQDGVAGVYLPLGAEQIRVQSTFLGQSSELFTLDAKKDYLLHCRFYMDDPLQIKNVLSFYRVISIQKGTIILQDAGGQIYTYHKGKRRKKD
ncbi:MAG: hypothetical protein R2794_00175 [Chitinophagales bacterium]